jgi:hypothetical protein
MQPLTQTPQLLVGASNRFRDSPHLLWCQDAHARVQASVELLLVSEESLLPFEVLLGQHSIPSVKSQ